MKICPKCKLKYADYPAISREDNKSEICSYCGIKEALEDYGKFLAGEKREKLKWILENIIDITKCDDSLFSDGIELDIRDLAEQGLEMLENPKKV